MVLLGLSLGPDAAAAVVAEGRLVAAVEQERVDRVRHSSAFPSGALDAALDAAGVRARDVDRVVVATPSGLGRGGTVAAAVRRSGLFMLGLELTRRRIEAQVRAQGLGEGALEVTEADRAQASAAYRTQPDDPALVVVVDGFDGAAVSVWLARHGQIDRLHSQTSLAALATLPQAVADRLGVEARRLGVLGAGTPADPRLRAALEQNFGLQLPRFQAMAPERVYRRIAELAVGFSPAVLAATTWAATVDAARAYVGYWAARTAVSRVVLGGRWFADPGLVGALGDLPGVRAVRVSPGLGTAAAAVGAALGSAGTSPSALPSLALGPGWTEGDCYKALSAANLPREPRAEPEQELARRVLAGELVARFDGRSPFGVRALGRRSVLFALDDAERRARVQRAQDRPEDAPVACLVSPATLEEVAEVPPSLLAAAGFGAAAFPARPAFRARCPAAVHVDGTVLPTPVGADDPALERVLARVRDETGAPAVGETSLNRGGTPMVLSPGDAVRSFRDSALDALLLGPYLVTRADVEASRRR